MSRHSPWRVDADSSGLALVRLPHEPLLEPIFGLARDPDVATHMEWGPHRSITDTHFFFQTCATDFASGRAVHFAVLELPTENVIGVASLLFTDGTVPCRIEATRWLGRAYWGRGIGTRLLSLLLHIAFTHFEAEEVFLRVAVENVAAQRSIRKLDIPLIYAEPEALAIQGRQVDCLRFSIRRGSWLANHGASAVKTLVYYEP